MKQFRLLLLLAMLLPAAVVADEDDDNDGPAPSRMLKVEGYTAIRLPRIEQERTHVVVQQLEAVTHQSGIEATGRILELEPLLDLRSEYHAARGEYEMAQAAAQATRHGVERLRILHREDSNISARQLQEAEAQAASDQARLTTAKMRLRDVESGALQQWGNRLVSLALEEDSELFSRIVSHKELLVLVTLYPGDRLPEGAERALAAPSGRRGEAREALLISAAPHAGALTQGETWFFRIPGDGLRIGMRLDVRVPREGTGASGVKVPDSALIWHANRLWAYVRQQDELFVRKPLLQYEEIPGGWFVREGLSPGEEVVVSGSQMLFAEEFRSGIPSEDEARE